MSKNEENLQEKKYKDSVEDIAKNISRLSREVKSLLSGRVQQKTIVILLAHSTGLPKSTVTSVIEAINNLEKNYLK